jgi:AcrR family transcriptional regulator
MLHALVEFQKLDINMTSSVSEASRSGGQAPLYGKLRPRPNGQHEEIHSNQRVRLYGAMVDAVAAHGYEATTVRELACLAGVSTRTLYERVQSKQACFLATHDILVRRTARRVLAAQKVAPDRQERLRLAFETFTHEVAENPKAGWLTLVEAPASGPAALQRTRHASRLFETMVAHSFRQAPNGAPAQTIITRGIVAGVAQAARGALLDGRSAELPASAEDLLGWARSCASPVASALTRHSPSLGGRNASGADTDRSEPVRGDDRARILRAATELAVADGHLRPTVAEILAGSSVTRGTFDSEFGGVEHCLLVALEEAHARILELASEAGNWEVDWSLGVEQGVDAVMRLLTCDRVLARLIFVEVFTLGLAGLQSRDRMLATWARMLRERAPPMMRWTPVTMQASVGAMWEVVRDHVVRGADCQLPRIAEQLSFMMLAPIVGADVAIEGIIRKPRHSRRMRCGGASTKKHRISIS